MKALITLAVVFLSFSANDADAQYFHPAVELTSHGVARQSPYAPVSWRARPQGTPADFAPTFEQRGMMSPPYAHAAYRSMPVGYDSQWRGQPNMSRYGGESPCPCVTVPISNMAPQGMAGPMGGPGAGYYTGHGIIGQPKLYVTGQPLRNALRFFTY